jgi:ATP-dependent protease ClpP protease subunit
MAAPVTPQITAKATASHHTGTDDSPWDAGKARKGYPNEAATLKAVHAWVDASGDPDSKSSYKFPHHYRKGGPANLAGCRNGLARLPGADVDDKDGVKRHLQAHLDDQPGEEEEEDRAGRPGGIDPGVMARVQAHLRARDQAPHPVRPSSQRPNLTVVTNKDSGPAVLRIYDAIGGWFGITASDVAEELDGIRDDRDLTVRINSPGGSVFDGTAIYNLLATRKGRVDVVVDGLAASAASFIAQAGDSITMHRGTHMMIHDGEGLTLGNAAAHRETADLLDGISDEIAGIYASRAGLTRAEWRDRMREEHWYNAEAAVEAGLADRTADADDQEDDEDAEDAREAAASWNLHIYGAAGPQPAVAAAARTWAQTTSPAGPDPSGDPFAEVDDEQMASLGETLADLFDPTGGYDPQVLGDLIGDVYADAPAPPTLPPPPEAPRTVIPIEELIQGIQEGVRP